MIVAIAVALTSCSEAKSERTRDDARASDASVASPRDAGSEPGDDDDALDEDRSAPDSQGSTTVTKPSLDAKTPLGDLPALCKGFEVLGRTSSPGGETLPNTCAPFHSTHNNPYAIRCVDADPSYGTKYPDDEYCILPPPPELGTQVHVGPEDYENSGEFVLEPGQEETRSYYINTSNEEDRHFYRLNIRLRHGAHHMVITAYDEDRDDGWGSNTGAGFGSDLGGVDSGNFGVTQRVDHDRPQGTLAVPAENVGLGGLLKAKQQLAFNLHNINIREEPVVREAWVNIWYMDENEVTKPLQPLAISANPRDVAIGPREHSVITYRCDVASDMRLITLYGHRHAQTDRFGVWVTKASGDTFPVYESFDWEDMPTYQYDTISMNPKPDLDMKIDGASTGMLELTKGDQLFFLCDVNNRLDTSLRYGNETIDGEMCILFGSYSGPERPCIGGPQRVKD